MSACLEGLKEQDRLYCLVVDDSPTIRRFSRKVLEGMSVQVEEAENGVVALESCARRMPDVILLDWNMPMMNGLEFFAALKQRCQKVPGIIFCTTEVEVVRIREALEMGADQYIMKPFDSTRLKEALRQVTENV